MKIFFIGLFAFSFSAIADLGAATCDRPATEMRLYVWTYKGYSYGCSGCYAKIGGRQVAINKIQIVDRRLDGSPNTIQVVDPANPGFHLVYDEDTFLRAIDDKSGALLAITSCPSMEL